MKDNLRAAIANILRFENQTDLPLDPSPQLAKSLAKISSANDKTLDDFNTFANKFTQKLEFNDDKVLTTIIEKADLASPILDIIEPYLPSLLASNPSQTLEALQQTTNLPPETFAMRMTNVVDQIAQTNEVVKAAKETVELSVGPHLAPQIVSFLTSCPHLPDPEKIKFIRKLTSEAHIAPQKMDALEYTINTYTNAVNLNTPEEIAKFIGVSELLKTFPPLQAEGVYKIVTNQTEIQKKEIQQYANILLASSPKLQRNSLYQNPDLSRLNNQYLSDMLKNHGALNFSKIQSKNSFSELLSKEFHIPESQARLLTESVVVSAHIASHAVPPDNLHLTPKEARIEAFKSLVSERVLEKAFSDSLLADTQASLRDAMMAENKINYEQIYEAAQKIELPDFIKSNPFINYIFEKGSARFKHEAGRLALQKFLSTETGKKVAATAAKTVGSETVKRFLAQAGVKAATTAATTAAGTEAGAAVGSTIPIIGTIIGAIVGATIGFVTSNWSKVKHEANEGAAALLVLGSTLWSSASNSALSVFQTVVNGFGSLVVESAQTLVVIVLTIPVVVALILFIINASAFVTPPSNFNAQLSRGANPDTFPPGPGGEYPQCWPQLGTITQGPYCTSGHPTWSHCKYDLNAIDVGMVIGTSLFATHDGIIGNTPNCGNYDAWGYCVIVKSSLGFSTRYAHMREPTPYRDGQSITGGTQVGYSGNTGSSTGAHLHYGYGDAPDDIRSLITDGNGNLTYKYTENPYSPTVGCLGVPQ